MTLQEKLKAATQNEHDQLEQLMYVGQIMSKTLTLDQYRKILTTNYLIHAAYEETLFSILPVATAAQLQVEQRKKLSALEKDIAQADVIPAPYGDSMYTQWDQWSALGALYVLEGATMGGKVIYRQLLANPNFTDRKLELNYYNIYGDELMINWKNFINIINLTPEEHHEEVITGAKVMFNEIAKTASSFVK